MNRKEHIDALVQLGRFLQAWFLGNRDECALLAGAGAYDGFEQVVKNALAENEWFAEADVRRAIAAITSEMLNESKLLAWLESYPDLQVDNTTKPVGVIAAGNIPLVCFHDLLCVLLSGYKLLLKPSSKDQVLIKELVRLLQLFESRMSNKILLTERVEPLDICALIATGSNNTARYFEYEYRDVPRLLRKSRTSVAVLTGEETEQELALLANDVFAYAGMGCRNISKLYAPVGYQFSNFIKAAQEWKIQMQSYPSYMHSYSYEKAVHLSLNEQLIDGEFFLLKQNSAYISPLAVVNFDFFTSLDSLKSQLISDADMLQCVVTAGGLIGGIHFGQAQQPSLSDYADGVDTMSWLTQKPIKCW